MNLKIWKASIFTVSLLINIVLLIILATVCFGGDPAIYGTYARGTRGAGAFPPGEPAPYYLTINPDGTYILYRQHDGKVEHGLHVETVLVEDGGTYGQPLPKIHVFISEDGEITRQGIFTNGFLLIFDNDVEFAKFTKEN